MFVNQLNTVSSYIVKIVITVVWLSLTDGYRHVTRHSLTVFDYMVMQENSKPNIEKATMDRKSHNIKSVRSVLVTGDEKLRQQHRSAWNAVSS